MIKQIKLLTALELKSLYGLNVFLHNKDKKAKRRYIGLMSVWILLIFMVFFYIGGLSYGLIFLGMSEIVPAYLIMLSSLVIFAFGIFKAGDMIFSKKGYDTLCSLPVSQTAIVISRFLHMYVEDLLLTLMVTIPGIAVYGFLIKPAIGFYLIGIISICLIPILPLVSSTIIGTVITALSSRMKHKSITQTVLTLGFVVVIMIGSFSLEKFEEGVSPEQLTQLAGTINALIGNLYPPALWLGNAMVGKGIGTLLLCSILYFSAFLFMVWIVAKNFHQICRQLFATSAKHNYRMERLQSKSILATLYQREFKRYFSSSIYVTNTIIGPILATIMAGSILFVGMEQIEIALAMSISLDDFIPFVLAMTFCMMTTTAVSISMEGKHFWIVKSLPIPTKTLLDSKILLNLSLNLPFYLLSELFLIIALKPNFLELLWLIVIPAIFIVFSCVAGITINLHFYRFDWEREEMVVKQGASTLISMLVGMFTPLLCIIPLVLLPNVADLLKSIMCIAIIGITMILYIQNNKTNLQNL